MKKFIALLLLAVALFFGGVYFLYQPPADRFPATTRMVQVNREEARLEQDFGDAYREYCRRTKKLIPFIW